MNFAFAGTLVLVVALTLSRAGISMIVLIVHSPLTKAKPALGLPLGLLPLATRNERFNPIVPRLQPPSILLISPRLHEECLLNFHAFQGELAFDLDKDFILDGLQNGFKLIKEPDVSGIAGYDAVNYASATYAESKPELDELFAKELGLGRISGVLVKPKCIHAIARVRRKDSGKSRPITDCSRPRGNSLNDYIKPGVDSIRVNSVDTAMSHSSKGCYYAVGDIESAWR